MSATIDNNENDEGLRIKSHCKCSNCDHWTNSVDFSVNLTKENFEKSSTRLEKEKKTPLLRTENNPGYKPKIVSFDYGKLSKMKRFSEYYNVLVHSTLIPTPVKEFVDLPFHPGIQLALKNMGYTKANAMQSFIWPAIFRQFNVFMVNNAKSGKTIAYLPAICSFVLQKESFNELAKFKGPLVIILCPNTKLCEDIHSLIRKLYGFSGMSTPHISIITYPFNHVKQPTTDFLITTPAILVNLLEKNLFSLNRLCYLILEDVNEMLRNDKENVDIVLQEADRMYLERTVTRNKLQFIATTKKWSTTVELLYKKIYFTPLICFGNALEATLYGKIHYEMRFTMSAQKPEYLLELLKTNDYTISKTIIFCHPSEIVSVEKFLNGAGIKTLSLIDEKNENLFNCYTSGHYRALLCSDVVFEQNLVQITDAQYLIHYSLTTTWTKFTQRFMSLAEHLKSPFEESDKIKTKCATIILIEESNKKQTPKLFNFLQRIGKKIPDIYSEYAENIKKEKEEKKILNKVKLCEELKQFGNCLDSDCVFRHRLSKELDVKDYLPKNGLVYFKIIDIIDVIKYSVELTKYTNPDGNVILFQPNINAPICYKNEAEEKHSIKTIEIGLICCYYDTKINNFYAGKILHIYFDHQVKVLSLNTGKVQLVGKKHLYSLPKSYDIDKHNQESSIVEVILANIVPPYKDQNFSNRSFQTICTLLQSRKEQSCFVGSVCLQLDNTLWLENIEERVKNPNVNVESVKYDLKRTLLKLNLIDIKETLLRNLRILCMDCNILLLANDNSKNNNNNNNNNDNNKMKKIIDEPQPQEAFLFDNEIMRVIFTSGVNPEEFYVRLNKFDELLMNLQKDIKDEINGKNAEIFTKKQNYLPSIGDYCLGKDEKNQEYSRAKILDIQQNDALIFYVDYGDEAVVKLTSLRPLKNSLIKKLPFQAIQCGLYGLSATSDEWQEEAIDILYKYLNEPNTDFYRALFVKKIHEINGDGIRTKIKNLILLKDGFNPKQILINKLLIDCGFAKENCKIEDFQILKQINNANQEEEEIEEIIMTDGARAALLAVGQEEEEEEEEDDGMEAFFDKFEEGEALLKAFFTPRNTEKAIKQMPMSSESTTGKDHDHDHVQIAAVKPSPDYLTPEVYWSQTEDYIFMKIKLIAVENYTAKVHMKKVFKFKADLDDKKYQLTFTLNHSAQLISHMGGGIEVRLKLKKTTKGEWLHLTSNNRRMRNIHYEYRDSQLKDQPKPRFLTLNISDDDDDDDDKDDNDNDDNGKRGNFLTYVEESDLESDLDFDLPSDSDD